MAGARPAGHYGLSCAGLPQATLIEGEMVRTTKTLKPGNKGTQGLPARFGRLLDVRCRYREDRRKHWILRREAAERLDLTSRAIDGAER